MGLAGPGKAFGYEGLIDGQPYIVRIFPVRHRAVAQFAVPAPLRWLRASSGGTVRLITNRPDVRGFEGSFDEYERWRRDTLGEDAAGHEARPVCELLLGRRDDALAKVGVEAAVRMGWDAIIGSDGIFIGMTSFGASAPYKELYKKFGITADAVAHAARGRHLHAVRGSCSGASLQLAGLKLSGRVGRSVMTLAGGLDHDGNGFGLLGGAIAGP